MIKHGIALTLLACFVLVTQATPSAVAGPDYKEVNPGRPALSHAEKALRENVLELQVETGATWSVGYTGNKNYVMAPQMVSLNWNLDDIGLDDFWGGVFRGNTQWKTSIIGSPVFNGFEHHMFGFAAGPQYNFVQPGWNLVPFISARVGLVFLDTTNDPNDIGQDFNFTFMVTPGARYFLSDHSSIGANFIYQHISNGGLSEPEVKNRALDLIGFQISFTHSF
ncbi:MAG TPA: acyloxyacyl hydrolase [Candidatus Methylacidiphilales bacterium]|nr:acyloxyacyl hydrolase [Candidatus Methylacidiphilales bacterium]